MTKRSECILIPVSAEMQRELIAKLRCIDGHMPAMLLGYYRSIYPEAAGIGKLAAVRFLKK